MPNNNINLFNPKTIDEQFMILGKHFPLGKYWQAVFDETKNIGKLIKGLATAFYHLLITIKKVETELDINLTNELLPEWEKSVGIPDDCFSINETLARRRLQVLEKFSNFGGVQKAEDFERVAAVFGFTVIVKAGKTVHAFPLEFPILFIGDEKTTGHTITVEFTGTPSDTFPLTFPVPFGSTEEVFIRCIFEKLAPANVQIMFI